MFGMREMEEGRRNFNEFDLKEMNNWSYKILINRRYKIIGLKKIN